VRTSIETINEEDDEDNDKSEMDWSSKIRIREKTKGKRLKREQRNSAEIKT